MKLAPSFAVSARGPFGMCARMCASSAVRYSKYVARQNVSGGQPR